MFKTLLGKVTLWSSILLIITLISMGIFLDLDQEPGFGSAVLLILVIILLAVSTISVLALIITEIARMVAQLKIKLINLLYKTPPIQQTPISPARELPMATPETLKVTLLGPSGVGKTSLLASMYNRFEYTVSQTRLVLKPNRETVSVLQRQLSELQSQMENFQARGGLSGTAEMREFVFDLGRPSKPPQIRLQFRDFPGGHIHHESGRTDAVVNYMRESEAIVLVVDAPALMTSEGRWHNAVNAPLLITTLFKELNLDEKRKLVLLVPVKCETYARQEADQIKLVEAVREAYAPLLNFLHQHDKVTVAITPVQTLGNAILNSVSESADGPKFNFRKTRIDAPYAPQDTEQPLAYILSFFIKLHLNERRGFWDKFNDYLFASDKPFRDAVTALAKQRKETRGFAVLQGQQQLDL